MKTTKEESLTRRINSLRSIVRELIPTYEPNHKRIPAWAVVKMIKEAA